MKEKRLIKKTVYHVITLATSIIMAYPLIRAVMSPFKENSTISSTAGSLISRNSIFSNYSTGWRGFGKTSSVTFFQNSIFISVVAIPKAVASSTLVAYGFVRFKLRGRGILFTAMLSSMILPARVPVIPQYLWYQKLDQIRFCTLLIVPHFFATQGSFMYLVSSFISGTPMGLDEAAKTDGCSYVCIFTRIMLPLIKPALVMICIPSLMWRWGDFLSTLLCINKSSMYPASLALRLFRDPGSSPDYGAMLVMATSSILPSILIFLSFQKYLVEGISTSGPKG